MKKNSLFLSIFFLFLIANALFAHGENGQKKNQQDSIETLNFPVVHSHQETDEHLMIVENSIVDAAMDDFSNLHPLVVHFPIVLLILAFLAQIASLFFWKKQLNWMTFLLLLSGFVGAYIASVFVHPHTTGLSEAATLVLEKHDLFADYTMWLSGIGLLMKAISIFFFKDKLWLEISIALLLTGAAFTVSKAGHYGATLAHIHGVGVQGNFIETHDDGHNHEH